MFKWLFRLLILLVLVLLGYNYFFGSRQEKESAGNVVRQFKELGGSIKDLLVSEKDKLDAGKYDEALDKVGTFIRSMRSSEAGEDVGLKKELDKLEKKKEQLGKDLEKAEREELIADPETRRKLREELRKLLEDTDAVISKYGDKAE